ncbi:MAG: hypothetical protein FJ396_09005 [Verrucomicrobia bacterium]|nr:hypothetical protein [Verrucomicrobiota bacterium]
MGDGITEGFSERLELLGELRQLPIFQKGGVTARALDTLLVHQSRNLPSLVQSLLLGEELGLGGTSPSFASAIHLVGETFATLHDSHLRIVFPDGGRLWFLGLELGLGSGGFHWHLSLCWGVSAEKVVGFLLGVNSSKISQNAQKARKH